MKLSLANTVKGTGFIKATAEYRFCSWSLLYQSEREQQTVGTFIPKSKTKTSSVFGLSPYPCSSYHTLATELSPSQEGLVLSPVLPEQEEGVSKRNGSEPALWASCPVSWRTASQARDTQGVPLALLRAMGMGFSGVTSDPDTGQGEAEWG